MTKTMKSESSMAAAVLGRMGRGVPKRVTPERREQLRAHYAWYRSLATMTPRQREQAKRARRKALKES